MYEVLLLLLLLVDDDYYDVISGGSKVCVNRVGSHPSLPHVTREVRTA